MKKILGKFIPFASNCAFCPAFLQRMRRRYCRHRKLDPSNPVSLELWHYYNGPQKVAFDEMVAEFNDTVGLEKGIIVEAFNQGSTNDLLTKVVDAANKKVGAADIPSCLFLQRIRIPHMKSTSSALSLISILILRRRNLPNMFLLILKKGVLIKRDP